MEFLENHFKNIIEKKSCRMKGSNEFFPTLINYLVENANCDYQVQ